MPRSFGRFTTSIWRDPDFTSLTLEQQAVYFTLGLQPDVTAAGVLPFTARRWAKLSSGTTRDQIESLVESLAEHAGEHLVIDDDTEELLIRKFIKWDGGWANAKRLPVVIDSVCGISSDRMRHTAIRELTKIASSDVASPDQQQAIWRRLDALSPSDRVVVTEVGNRPQPSIPNQEREPSDLEPEPLVVVGDEPPPMTCPQHPKGTDKACGQCGAARMRFARWSKLHAAQEAEKRRQAEQQKSSGVLADLADARARAVPRPKDVS